MPLQPHTGSMFEGQAAGAGMQTPSASGVQAPSGLWQTEPDGQVIPAVPPHATSPAQGPACSTATPATSALQELS